jgi:hypothetical protein
MNQAVSFLPVNTLYNALQFLIKFLTFAKLMKPISFSYLKAKIASKRKDLIVLGAKFT